MEIIEFKFDDKKTILAGVPKSGRIQFVMSCTYSDTGEIVAGYSGESKYKFYHKKNDVFKPIKIALSLERSIELPEVTAPIKAQMPDDAKLDLYRKLRKDLEEAGLI
jgi:hypothetical protein